MFIKYQYFKTFLSYYEYLKKIHFFKFKLTYKMLIKKILTIKIIIIFYLNDFLLQSSNKSTFSLLRAYLLENYDILSRPQPFTSNSLVLPTSLSISLTLHQILSLVKVFKFFCCQKICK
jgi:phage-related holin